MMNDLDLARALAEMRGRDREAGATWFTGPASFTAQSARDRRTLLLIVEQLQEKIEELDGELHEVRER